MDNYTKVLTEKNYKYVPKWAYIQKNIFICKPYIEINFN